MKILLDTIGFHCNGKWSSLDNVLGNNISFDLMIFSKLIDCVSSVAKD